MFRKYLFVLTVVAVAAGSVHAFAQTDLVELLRSDLRTQKSAILTEALSLTEEESAIFWPIYREYEASLMKIGDERIAIIKDYAAGYDTMTDEAAKGLVKRSFATQESRHKLQKRYYSKFEKALSARTAARWIQAETAIGNMIDLQIASELPLIKK